MISFPLFELRQYGVRLGQKTLLRDITCLIPNKAVTAILGSERSGKTLLLHALNGFAAFFSMHPGCSIQVTGSLYFRGQLLTQQGQQNGYQSCSQQRVLVVPEMFPGSIFDNVAYGLRLAKLPPSDLFPRVAHCLSQVGLEDWIPRWHDLPEGFSPGQKQQLALARALAVEPKVLLLDEPWRGLDAPAQAHLNHLLRSLCADCAVVVVSRDYRSALRIADWLLLLEPSQEGGYLLAAGSPQELMMTSPNRAVQEYWANSLPT